VDWKNHPAIIAAISAASTIAFCITFILPIYEKKNINQIEDLESQITHLKESNKSNNEKSKAEISSLKTKSENFEQELKRSKQRILYLQEEDRFTKESPLPKGFRDIYPLDLAEKVLTHYKSTDIETQKRWHSVEIKDNLFRTATYYRLKHKNKEYISHILFHFKFLSPLNKDYKIRSENEILQYTKNLRETTSKILHEKFGPSTNNEDGHEIFIANNIWHIKLSDSGVVISTLYEPESILDALNQSCPIPENSTSETIK